MVPSRIGTAMFAVFVTTHGPVAEGADGAPAQAAEAARIAASETATADFRNLRTALPRRPTQVYTAWWSGDNVRVSETT
jgi:hypothetical protein